MEQKYKFIEVTLDGSNFNLIKEVYRLHKEQANKIFDLACNIKTDSDLMDYVKYIIDDGNVFLVEDTENKRYSGCIILCDIYTYDNVIVRCNSHIAISKKYWGRESRNIVKGFYKFIKEYFIPINRIEACVPSNNFGIIKLLKDVGFKIEGTSKNKLLYLDKNNNPKYYNELIYGNTNLGD